MHRHRIDYFPQLQQLGRLFCLVELADELCLFALQLRDFSRPRSSQQLESAQDDVEHFQDS